MKKIIRSLTLTLCIFTITGFAKENRISEVFCDSYNENEFSCYTDVEIITYFMGCECTNDETYIKARYLNGVSVVTCIKGKKKGQQRMIFEGKDAEQKIIESTNVEWRNDYFTHYYLDGKVETYRNMQIIQLY